MAPDADALLEACCCHCMLPIGNGTPTGPAVRPEQACLKGEEKKCQQWRGWEVEKKIKKMGNMGMGV